MMKRIVDVRALVQEGAGQGADYHAKPDGRWIASTVIVTPPSQNPAYRETRRSCGIDVPGAMLGEMRPFEA